MIPYRLCTRLYPVGIVHGTTSDPLDEYEAKAGEVIKFKLVAVPDDLLPESEVRSLHTFCDDIQTRDSCSDINVTIENTWYNFNNFRAAPLPSNRLSHTSSSLRYVHHLLNKEAPILTHLETVHT